MGAFNPGPATGSVRPPTPPKESTSKLPNGDDPNSFSNSANRPLLDTPDESPSSSAEYYKASAERSQKKVGFSPWTEFHKLPMTGNKDSDSEGSIRRLPPSKDCKSLKSILKACKDNTTTDFENQLPAFDQTNLVTMLNSAIQHLKAPTNKSRTEAYVALLACLSAYDDAPETTDMSEIVSEFTGYIRRDICAKAESDDGLDTQLATQALKVLTVLLCTPSIATVLPEDFCSFILERSLTSIEDASSPKILVAHYMHLLEKQKFTVKVMTTERVNRLLTGLDLVTNRIKGNRVVCHRLMIYQRLMTQAKSVMSSRVGSWIDHLISGMLSSIKDVRVRAIAFGLEAGLQLGTTSSVSHSCIDVFNRASPEGKRVVDFLSSRLLEMVGSKEDGVHVPQIWSIIILFFRSRRRQLECWEHIKAWLVIIQRCLNSSDPQVKLQVNIAWSRLIFVINLDTSTSVSMAKMLRQPLVPQLERRTSDKTSKQAKGLARSTYCTLLYYAFRPTATTLQIGQYWDLYIAQILPKSFTAGKSDVNYACDIFAALLSSNGKPRMWDENRANVNGPVKPDELPCIDSKWVRSKSVKIIQIFETLFDLADWKMNKDYEAPLLLAWRSFVTAIGTASSKEVKVSMDTMNAVSQIINLLKRLLEKRTQQQESDRRDPKDLFYKINRLTQEAVAKIGSIPFLERRIVLTSHNSFEAAETPSNRSIKDSSSLNSPATHLLHLLFTHAQNGYRTTAYPDAVKAVMHISLQSANTRRAQLGAIRNLARLLSTTRAFDRQACTIFWRLLAEATCSSLKIPRHSDPYNASPQYPGHEIREAVKILDIGIQQRSGEIVPAWLELYDCIASSLRQEIGNDAINLLMIDPLADIMKDCSGTCDDALLILSAALLKNVHWPQSHQLTERAEKMLWGVTHTPHRKKSDTLFNVFYMSNALLCSAYVCLTQLSAEVVVAFLSSVVNAIGSCPPEHQETMLSQMQPGLAAWIEDPDGLLRSSANGLSLKVGRPKCSGSRANIVVHRLKSCSQK